MEEEKKEYKPWQFQKGQSGNPKGRPKKGKTYPDLIAEELKRVQQEMTQKDGSIRTVDGKQMLVITLIRMALFSDDEKVKLMAIDKLMDREEGKPMQSVSMDAVVESNSVFDDIDVSKLSAKDKGDLENILKKMYS